VSQHTDAYRIQTTILGQPIERHGQLNMQEL